MANTFKNAVGKIIATPGSIIYTAPAGKIAVIHTIIVSNTALTPETVSIELVDASAGTAYKIVTHVPIPSGSSLSIPKPINLESGDSIRVIASTVGTLEAVASVLEIG